MKVLFFGLGSIGQRHLRNLKKLLGDEAEILACRTRGLGRVLTDQMTILPDVNVEKHYGIRVFHDIDSALNAQPEVVFVTNPSSLHLSVAMSAAEAGCHLFLEKPVSHTLDGVDDLVSLVEQKGLVAAVGYQMRFHPCLRLLKSLVETEAVGPLLSVAHEQGEYIADWHPYEDYRQLFGARRELGGGVLLAQIHELDTIYWLYGMPSRVWALGGHWSDLDVDVEDVVDLMFDYRKKDRPLSVHLHQDYVRRPPVLRYRLIGETGVILADLIAQEVSVIMRESKKVTIHRFEGFERNQMFLDELQHFLRCLRGEAEPLVDIRGGSKSLRLAVAARDSMSSGEVQKL